jgi:hypothetical protein
MRLKFPHGRNRAVPCYPRPAKSRIEPARRDLAGSPRLFLRLGAIHFYLRLHRRYSACSLLRSTCRRKPLFRRRMCWEGVDALHNNVFGTKIMKDGSQRREPETSVFVLIARRMEPEHPAVRLKGHSAQAPEWPFAISRSVSARRKRAVIEIARSKTRSRGAAYRPCTARLIESPVARTP